MITRVWQRLRCPDYEVLIIGSLYRLSKRPRWGFALTDDQRLRMDLDARVQHSCEHAELTTEFGAIKIASRHTIRLFRISLAEEFSSRKTQNVSEGDEPGLRTLSRRAGGGLRPFQTTCRPAAHDRDHVVNHTPFRRFLRIAPRSPTIVKIERCPSIRPPFNRGVIDLLVDLPGVTLMHPFALHNPIDAQTRLTH